MSEEKPIEILGIIAIFILVAISGVSLFFQLHKNEPAAGGVNNTPIAYTATNTTTTIKTSITTIFNTTSTAYSIYARISNPTKNNISCYLESAFPASSTLSISDSSPDAGIMIGASSSTVFSGENSVCFGTAAGCIPYIGPVNCIANTSSVVGITYK